MPRDRLELDIVVPVHNEAHVLVASVHALHSYLQNWRSWQITIAENGSTDDTLKVAHRLAAELPHVRVIEVDGAGRGLALRSAWTSSDASILAYTDVDLSTGLDALHELVAAVRDGRADIAIGCRLASESRIVRGVKREVISRCYNALLHHVLGTSFRDAQCGFKAIRADVAAALLPDVQDNGWFFDTELLVLAARRGHPIHEVPVDWVDDPDSRVHIVRTAWHDLRGIARVRRRHGRIH
ncbi:MAG: putative dolichyl-phosphate beta-glucosyltransferase [Ilumatobacteraceae bacterium]|nr:putative dolichyl-phosphate beta-glucosyltransferase [Ilumatobacteraceae bacterium]